MFLTLGKAVSKQWKLFLVGWVVVIAAIHLLAPALESVVQDGEFAFMPSTVPSRQGEALFRQAFSKELLGSSVVIVARRTSRPEGLQDTDRQFIDDILKPRLEAIQTTFRDESVAHQRDAVVETQDAAESPPAEDPASAADVTIDDEPQAEEGFLDDYEESDFEEGETSEGETMEEAIVAEDDASGFNDDTADGFTDDTEAGFTDDTDESAAGPEGLADFTDEMPVDASSPEEADAEPASIVTDIRTFSDRSLGHLLESNDKKASLVYVEMRYEFLDKRNRPAISAIEELIGPEGTLRQERLIPPGLDLAMSGSATVGRDMTVLGESSADATEKLTVALVIVLLIIIYRAPFLAIIPLMTVGVSVHLAISVLSILADAGIIELFNGIKVYVTVVLYGAGVDYCVFLIARYKEELDLGATYDEGIQQAVGRVGAALAASAGTTMCGIGMMVFAEFGKFSQAGVAISLSLSFVLLSALTFTPAVLLLFGRWTFWPKMPTERIPATPGWFSPTSLIARLIESNPIDRFWRRIGKALLARPGTIWLATVAVMMPFAVVAVMWHEHLSYGLLSELPKNETSVVGARAIQSHFPAGVTGPVSILIENHELDFTEPQSREIVEEFTRRLVSRKDELGITDVRSVSQPLGIRNSNADEADSQENRKGILGLLNKGVRGKRVRDYFVADKDAFANRVTRIDVEFENDPFSRESIADLDRMQQTVDAMYRQTVADVFVDAESGKTASEVQAASSLHYIGATPSIRDLKTVTNRDQIRIDILVLAGVFVILVILLRKIATPGYLIVSVFFSYLVTLGVTFTFFWALDPSGFAGLDWKVPMFLFTILIAVGEDYNIYLITRIEEEQQEHGPIKGITEALGKTGGIISSCGIIMAGTFSSLMAGSLVGTDQLGFALAFGVLVDTFVVRPVLVPAYLIMLHSGRFGVLGRFLGAREGEYIPARMTPSLKIGRKR